MKKTFLSIIMTLSLVLSLFVTVSANEDMTIYVNDEILQCDIAPFISEGRTMVPMRKIFEALNATVDWEATTQTITATKDNTQIVLQINNSTMYHNGVAETLDVAPVIVDGSTFVPIRAVSQSLNASVDWFGHTQTVYINSAKTYNEEYNSFLDFYMQVTVPAGYEWLESVADNAVIHADICAQGLVTDVQINDNDVYLILNNRYLQGENIAIYIADTESTSIEKMTEIFKNTNVSVGGRYLGVTDAFNTPAISMQYVSIFESESFYEINELTYPNLSLLGQTVTLYDQENQSLDVPVTQVDDYLDAGWSTEAMVTMYAPDGRTVVVADSEVLAYESVGWYSYPVTTMYAPDGRTVVVANSEVLAYESVGWYRTYEEAQTVRNSTVNDEGDRTSSTGGQFSGDISGTNTGKIVYIGHTGNKYHTKNCRTLKNGAIPISLAEAKAEGRTACKVCH